MLPDIFWWALCKTCTCNFLTFANMTAIACHRNIEVPGNFLPICNSSCVRKRQKITSMCAGGAERVREIGCWFASLVIFILLV